MLFMSLVGSSESRKLKYIRKTAFFHKKHCKLMFFWIIMPFESGSGIQSTQNIQWSEGMKVRIEDNCTACGMCVDTCPEVFTMGDAIAEVVVDEVPAELEEIVQQAADECPVEAIVVE
jgi:ferredoxin